MNSKEKIELSVLLLTLNKPQKMSKIQIFSLDFVSIKQLKHRKACFVQW